MCCVLNQKTLPRSKYCMVWGFIETTQKAKTWMHVICWKISHVLNLKKRDNSNVLGKARNSFLE